MNLFLKIQKKQKAFNKPGISDQFRDKGLFLFYAYAYNFHLSQVYLIDIEIFVEPFNNATVCL